LCRFFSGPAFIIWWFDNLNKFLGVFRKISNNDCQLRLSYLSVCLPVCPHGTTRLPLDGFPSNMMFETFTKISPKIQVLLTPNKYIGYFTWRPMYNYDYVSHISFLWLPGVFPGGKGGRCVTLTTLPPSCAVVMKSGNLNFLQPSGPLQARNGTALPFTVTFLF